MPVPDMRNLVFLERQFNDIKPLIPVANALIAAGHAESKLVKNAFRQCSAYWDQLHTVPEIKLPIHEIPEEEKDLLQKILFTSMAFMVEVQRTSESAVRSLKVAKSDLMRLLGNLSTQVLADISFEAVPAFSQLSIPMKLKRASAKEFRESSRAFREVADVMSGREIDPATLAVWQENLRCIGHFANPDTEMVAGLRWEQKNYTKKAKSLRNRSHVSQANLHLQSMHAIRIEQIVHLSRRSIVVAEKLKLVVESSN